MIGGKGVRKGKVLVGFTVWIPRNRYGSIEFVFVPGLS
jgi:hypothetical protein